MFDEITCLKNLFKAWEEFKRGKAKKIDVKELERNYKNNIFNLYKELKNKTYKHSAYFSFYVEDPKLRHIHKATVKDRVLHHAIFRILYPIFDRAFIFDSYSCRMGKGTHRAVNRLQYFANKVSKNNTNNCYVLKCDVKKYFDSINHSILIDLIKKKIEDKNVLRLIDLIINSYSSSLGTGIPLGNITSQLFANIYLDELDKFVKQDLKIKYYIRYCDDFIILDANEANLKSLICKIDNFLQDKLKLSLHPNKVEIRKYRQGIDFLGYVSFPYHRILRVKTKNRIIRKLGDIGSPTFSRQTIQSYLGVLKHCDSYKLKKEILDLIEHRA